MTVANSPGDFPSTVASVSDVPAQTPLPELPGYEVLALVGRGGMGRVFRARHRGLNRIVAVKVLALDPDEKALARFREEARAVAKLQHPNIAQVFDTGTADGRPFFAQEYLEGGSLSQRFEGKPQELKFVAGLVETIARAIQHSHDQGILHRDLKPGNIVLTADGTPKVTDFGLAKELPTAGETARESGGGLTRTGEILGTPAYMPPEQASGVFSNIGPTADVYALGAILYEGLTGRPPFLAPDALQTLFMVLGMEPISPRTLQPKLPKDLETICLKCLEKSPRRRYATAAALADDLRRFVNGETILARPVGLVERASKWARRRKAVAALLALSLLFALAIFAGAIWLAISNERLAAAKKEVDDTNTQLVAAKTQSDQAFGLATNTLDTIVTQNTLKLVGIPKAEAVLLDTLAQASALNKQLVELRSDDREAIHRYARALSQQVAYETNYHRTEAAARTRAALDAFLSAEVAKMPGDAELRGIEVRLAYNATLVNTAPPAEMERAFQRLVERTDAFAADFPERMETRGFVVNKWWAVAAERSRAGDYRGQVKAFESATVEARKYAKDEWGLRLRGTFLVTSLMQLGMVRKVRQEYDAANDAFEEIVQEYAGRAESETSRYQIATARMNQASILAERDETDAALKRYSEVEPVLRKLTVDFPLNPAYTLNLSECLYWKGSLTFPTDPTPGLAQMDEAIRLMDSVIAQAPREPAYAQIRRAYAEMRDKLADRMKKKLP